MQKSSVSGDVRKTEESVLRRVRLPMWKRRGFRTTREIDLIINLKFYVYRVSRLISLNDCHDVSSDTTLYKLVTYAVRWKVRGIVARKKTEGWPWRPAPHWRKEYYDANRRRFPPVRPDLSILPEVHAFERMRSGENQTPSRFSPSWSLFHRACPIHIMRHIFLNAKSNLKIHLRIYSDLLFIKWCTCRGLLPAQFFAIPVISVAL